MWCPGWDYSSTLLLSMGGGSSGGVRVSRMCGVGEPWDRLSYLSVLSPRS